MKIMKILSYKDLNLFLCYNCYGDNMIKRLFLFISLIVVLTGCNNNGYVDKVEDTAKIEDNTEIIEVYKDENPVKVGLYQNGYKVKSYKTSLKNFKDIGVFDIYFTDIDKVDSTKTKTNYEKYFKEYEDISNCKTGFYISFMVGDEKYEEVIFDPSKQHAMTPYLYIYLYDDVNQVPGTYYSHLEPKDMKDNTIISSVKLFLAQEGSKISSSINFTVFAYDSEDDFDENNMYRGNSVYSIEIETKQL